MPGDNVPIMGALIAYSLLDKSGLNEKAIALAIWTVINTCPECVLVNETSLINACKWLIKANYDLREVEEIINDQ